MRKLSSSHADRTRKSIEGYLSRIGELVENNQPATYRCPDCQDRDYILSSRPAPRLKYLALYGQRCRRCLERDVMDKTAETAARIKSETGVDPDNIPF